MKGHLGIAHTRWASTGKPTDENAHPHLDEANTLAIVHNGTLENYNELKKELLNESHTFKSTTDSEVIAHLIKRFMDKGFSLENALRKSSQKLKGSYAIVAISSDEKTPH